MNISILTWEAGSSSESAIVTLGPVLGLGYIAMPVLETGVMVGVAVVVWVGV